MKKFDFNNLTVSNYYGITPKNFKSIYLPFYISMVIFILGAIVFALTNNKLIFKGTFGLTGIVLALSGLGQIKLREVPGFPAIRGGCAVVFGIMFLIFFLSLGVGVFFLE